MLKSVAMIKGVFLFFLWACSLFFVQPSFADEQDMSDLFRNITKIEEETFFPEGIEIEDRDGNMVALFDSGEGQFTVLNLWATWCPSCIKELPSLSRLNSSVVSKKGWRVMAVSIDMNDQRGKVLDFIEERNLSEVAAYFDSNLSLQKNMNIRGLPVTWILDDKGRILYEITGIAEWDRLAIISFLLGMHS
ncbi:MAG: TlpA family protein disulfide reductase [Alphaproteobacteria bacterium]